MDSHHLDGMVQRLKPVLKDRSKAKTILTRYWQDKMALVWEVEDVHRAANEREVALTNQEAIQVLSTLHSQHNKQYGIQWKDLTTHIEDNVMGRKLTKSETSRFVTRNIITINQ